MAYKVYKIAYFTIEDISSGLFKTQVLNKLAAISKKNKNYSIDLICINRPWKLLSHINTLFMCRNFIRQNNININIIYIPFMLPLRNALKSLIYTKFVKFYLYIWLVILRIKRYKLIHVRSYLPMFSLSNFNHKNLIFDTRSIWIDENISTGDLIEGSTVHKYLLGEERKCLISANQICVVSKPMIQHYENKVKNLAINLIPISFDQGSFSFDVLKRQSIRSKYQLENSYVFVYLGSFGQSGVNTQSLIKLFNSILKIDNSKLLLLTAENNKTVSNLLGKIEADTSKVILIEPTFSEISGYLSAADIGLHALPNQIDSDSRLGTKVIEYLACGLPVIVNENVGAASRLLLENRLGSVINLDSNLTHYQEALKELIGLNRSAIEDFAVKNFSSTKIADDYLRIYLKALKG
ncbi:glycosyltransferase [Polynucleobacter sp. AP-Feld-500C-C5]|uniref:glycosyltransferase n=1 Tax=Polynucleobacter sp. AP-Feld-500C-C5 TaxID=2576924 RepID=UPI001C0BAC20|nr:glycosyltransferase [Polynucleobacter sp. AP-Feld-500C-C5]MBU3632888.1 glycosyltransferase [Polynucleobacter sp. AP-Feld-500C-C5]